MAKKLIATGYTINAAQNQITVPGIIQPVRLLLITDINNNKILYNFADPAAGLANYSFNYTDDTTTFTTSLDLSAQGVQNSHGLQIFYETDFQRSGFEEAMLDPVNKLRVSNPENLIDTDFEYGLQSSKWETLQTVLNIPTIFSQAGDVPLEQLSAITTTQNSKQVKVTTTANSGLSLGDPILVQGTTLNAADGFFLVSGLTNQLEFFYEMDNAAESTATISGSYTSVIPAKFFEGSNLNVDLTTTAIATDGANPSTMTVTTGQTHGLKAGTRVYLRQTVGPKNLRIADPTANGGIAPDGAPWVDTRATITTTTTVDATTSIGGGGAQEFPVVTWDWEGTYNLYLAASMINTSTDRITWTGHGFADNAALLFQTQIRGQTNGGLVDGTVYYVNVVDANTIELYSDYGVLSSRMNLTSFDFTRGHPRLTLVYKIEGNNGTQRFTSFYKRNLVTGRAFSAAQPTQNTTNQQSFNMSITTSGFTPIKATLTRIYYNGNLNDSDETVAVTITARNYLGLGSNNYSITVGGVGASSGNLYPNADVTRCIYQQGSNFYLTTTYQPTSSVIETDKAGTVTTNYQLTFYATTDELPTSMNTAHSGSDLASGNNNFGLGGSQGSKLFAFTGRTPGGSAGTSADNYANNNDPARYGTGILRQTGGATASSVSGIITVNQTDSNAEDYVGNSTHVYYGFANELTSYRNTIYAQSHNFIDGNSAVINVNSYSTTNRFEFVDSSGNNVPITDSQFNAVITVISADYFRLQISQSPNTDDLSAFPETFTVATATPNTTYNSIYVSNHKLTGGNLSTYSTTGTVIGGLTGGSNYTLQYLNDSRLIIKDPNLSAGSGSATTSAFGSTSNNASQSFTVDIETPLGLTPSTATITQVQFRGDFGFNSEYVDLTFSDGDSYRIGSQGGQDTNQFLIDSAFGSKNISNLLTGSPKSIQVTASPSSQINFAVQGMTNWWELRFAVTAASGDVILTSAGTGEQLFELAANEGAYDGVYGIASVPTATTFTLASEFQIPNRVISFNAATKVNSSTDKITLGTQSPFVPHNLYPGEQVTYANGGNADIGVFADVAQLYVIANNSIDIQLASSYASAIAGTALNLTATSGTHTLTSNSLVKMTKGDGTVDFANGGNMVTGANTTFLKDYKRFDKIYIIVNDLIRAFTVDAVMTDGKMRIQETFPGAGTTVEYFKITQLSLRPDGFALHKSFDGGVDITAGTSPNSKIVRQSRKYFRYQSGKGIQNSFAINFSPAKVLSSLTYASSGNVVTAITQEPHNLVVGDRITVEGAEVTLGENLYLGTFQVASVPNATTFTYVAAGSITQTKAAGFPEYYRESWNDSFVRAGMFDDQNGFFYEYDGQKLYCVRRSSTLQISGKVNTTANSQVVTGITTSFTTQLAAGDKCSIRGQSYQVVAVDSDQRMIIQPAYKGVSATNVKITKTVDVKVAQENWNVDPCDGLGDTGFNLNVHKIQMGYVDYSWYGAGKIRFGFKDRNGHVHYNHEFIHNNRLNESYFRSGNLPGRYEIENGDAPSSAPTLFHFGTSIIMDGTFDDDKAYLFSANSKPMVFKAGSTTTFTTDAVSTFDLVTLDNKRVYVYALPCSAAEATSVNVGQLVKDAEGRIPSDALAYVTQVIVDGANSKVFTSYPATANPPETSTYPNVTSGVTITVGENAYGGGAVDMTRPHPLISIRLAPSVDSGLTGSIGQKEIINRMILSLNNAGVTTNKDLTAFFILNGLPSKLDYTNVQNPALSQLISHDTGDTIQQGTVVFSQAVSSGSLNIDLTALIDMGNSILGGDSVFPAGPDLMTLAIQAKDTSEITSSSPFIVSGKLSWKESQT